MSLVSRYMSNPGNEHWKAVQWIFRYLRGTTDSCLKFGRTDQGPIGYVDSDYAADLDKRRSLTGYVFTVGSCAVSWKAILQPVVAMSTTKAEYMAITEACKESVWRLLCCVELILALIYSVTVKVLFASPKIRCFMKVQSILMSSTIMFVMLFHKIN